MVRPLSAREGLLLKFDGFLDAADSQLGASIFDPFVLDEIERGCV